MLSVPMTRVDDVLVVVDLKPRFVTLLTWKGKPSLRSHEHPGAQFRSYVRFAFERVFGT